MATTVKESTKETAKESKQSAIGLTVKERKLLSQQEAVIQQYVGEYIQVGAALAIIRENRLYRESHATFEEYMSDVFDISRKHAYRLISAVNVYEFLKSKGYDILPSRESIAREMDKLQPEQILAVWEEVIKRHTERQMPITAANINRVVRIMIYNEPEGEETEEVAEGEGEETEQSEKGSKKKNKYDEKTLKLVRKAIKETYFLYLSGAMSEAAGDIILFDLGDKYKQAEWAEQQRLVWDKQYLRMNPAPEATEG